MIDLSADNSLTVRAIVEYMYTDGYERRGFGSSILDQAYFSTDVYATAGMYRMKELQDHALGDFERTLYTPGSGRKVYEKNFAKFVIDIFEKTPDTDKGLRELILDWGAKEFQLTVQAKSFCNELKEAGVLESFQSEMLSKMYEVNAQLARKASAYQLQVEKDCRARVIANRVVTTSCIYCDADVKVFLPSTAESRHYPCPACRELSTVWEWRGNSNPSKSSTIPGDDDAFSGDGTDDELEAVFGDSLPWHAALNAMNKDTDEDASSEDDKEHEEGEIDEV